MSPNNCSLAASRLSQLFWDSREARSAIFVLLSGSKLRVNPETIESLFAGYNNWPGSYSRLSFSTKLGAAIFNHTKMLIAWCNMLTT